jgi:hypothetical protein
MSIFRLTFYEVILRSSNKGRPSISSFDRIKTYYWFHIVKSEVNKLLIKNAFDEREQLKSTRYSPLTKSEKDKKLKSLDTVFTRATSTDPKWGPTDPELTKIIAKAVKDQNLKELLPDKNTGTGLPSDKTWGRYRVAENKPDRALEQLNLLFKGTKRAFTHGPFSLFKILEAPNITEALDLFEIQFKEILESKKEQMFYSPKSEKFAEEPSILLERLGRLSTPHKKNAGDRYNYYLKVFLSLKDTIFSESLYNSDVSDQTLKKGINILAHVDSFFHLKRSEAACLYLSLAFIGARFLDDYHGLKVVCSRMHMLDVLEYLYSIPSDTWFIENKEPEHFVILDFLEAKTR